MPDRLIFTISKAERRTALKYLPNQLGYDRQARSHFVNRKPSDLQSLKK